MGETRDIVERLGLLQEAVDAFYRSLVAVSTARLGDEDDSAEQSILIDARLELAKAARNLRPSEAAATITALRAERDGLREVLTELASDSEGDYKDTYSDIARAALAAGQAGTEKP